MCQATPKYLALPQALYRYTEMMAETTDVLRDTRLKTLLYVRILEEKNLPVIERLGVPFSSISLSMTACTH